MGKGPRKLGALLGAAYASLGVAPDSPEMVLRARWAEAVGPDVASLTYIDRLERGRLVMVAENPVWCFELNMKRESLRDTLNAFLGKAEIREVQVKGRRYDGA